MRTTLATLTALPLLAATLGQDHGHTHNNLHRRVFETEVVVVTETVYTTVTIDASSSTVLPTISISSTANTPENTTSCTINTPTPSSTAAVPKNTANTYTPLPLEPYHALILNSCDYDVYVSSIGDESCGPANIAQIIPANTMYAERIRTCYKSGVSLKVGKTAALDKPMQFEYTVWDDKKTVSYDISYLDCMVEGSGGGADKDFSACVGHEKGIQAAAGKDCPVFQCEAGVECAQQAYTVPEFGYLPGAPVGACSVDQGIAFELCAENRALWEFQWMDLRVFSYVCPAIYGYTIFILGISVVDEKE